MRRTVGLLMLGLLALGALAATSVHDLISARTMVVSGPIARMPVTVQVAYVDVPTWDVVVPTYGPAFTSGDTHPQPSTIPAAQWWRSMPTLVLAIVAIALVTAAFAVAARRGVYAPQTLRMLGAAGLVTLVGGPIAALVGYLSSRWAAGDANGATLWMPTLVYAVIGGALLAIRGLLSRGGAMRAELDGVI